MRLKQWIGLIAGLGGLVAFPLLDFPGLALPAAITLGIFWMGACFWITEPVPIYATSMLVIFMQIMLLSNAGPVALYDPIPTAFPKQAEEHVWAVPQAAVKQTDKGDVIYLIEGKGRLQPLAVEIKPLAGDAAGEGRVGVSLLRGDLSAKDKIVADASHWQVAYRPDNFSTFYASLASPIIILFLGGFALAAAAVKFGLDRNITRVLLRPFGCKPAYVCLGLMLVTALLSAFMSNTATTAMMMTVALPIIAQLKSGDPFRKLVVMTIPTGANIGGIITPIGSPPNAIALAALNEQGFQVPFSTWMFMMAPLALVMILISWRGLLFLFPPATTYFKLEMGGKFDKSFPAIATYTIFGITVLLWVTEKLHGIPATLIAFIPVALLPAIGVLTKKDIRGFSWEVLWLVAGGISLGISMQNTGMAHWLVNQISWSEFSGFALILVFGLVAFLIANLVSHTVSATILIPLAVGVVLAGGGGDGLNIVSAILVVGIVVGFSMLLPISTPPNAIAMSSNMIETNDMMKIGSIVGVAGYVGTVVFGILIWPLIL